MFLLGIFIIWVQKEKEKKKRKIECIVVTIGFTLPEKAYSIHYNE